MHCNSAASSGSLSRSWAFQTTRPLSHRPILEIHNTVGGRAAEKFRDKRAPDVVLLDRAKRSGNETPQPGDIARRVSIARDNSRAENREALEAYRLNRLFLQTHHPRVANPAFRAASRCREQRKPCDPPGVTPAREATDHADFEGLQFLLAPLHAALTDANAGCPIDRIALRNYALRKPGHFRRKPGRCRIQDHLPHTGIPGQGNRPAIDHHDFGAGRLCGQRAHHRSPHLPRSTCYQDTKCHRLFSGRAAAPHPTVLLFFPAGIFELRSVLNSLCLGLDRRGLLCARPTRAD